MPDEHNTRDNAASDMQREVTLEHMRRSAPNNARDEAERLRDIDEGLSFWPPDEAGHESAMRFLRRLLDDCFAALRDALKEVMRLQSCLATHNNYNAAKDDIVAAGRKLLDCKVGFHSDNEGIAAARRELREALARLDVEDNDAR